MNQRSTSKVEFKNGSTFRLLYFSHFRCSGASFAYNTHIHLGSTKQHGSWTSDCVWSYIQTNQNSSRDIAASFANIKDNALNYFCFELLSVFYNVFQH